MAQQLREFAHAGFASTAWTRVGQAGDASQHQEMAWEWLFRSYWNPLFAFLEREGHRSNDAEEILQKFFTWLTEKNIVGRAQRERGRFRDFLLVSLKQFVQRERRQARRRIWSRFQPLQAETSSEPNGTTTGVPADKGLSPDAVFERDCALEMLRAVMTSLEVEFDRAGDAARFAVLKSFLTYESEANYRAASAALGVSEGAVRVAVHRLRQRFGELLREQIAPTVACDAEINEEIADLRQALGAR